MVQVSNAKIPSLRPVMCITGTNDGAGIFRGSPKLNGCNVLQPFESKSKIYANIV